MDEKKISVELTEEEWEIIFGFAVNGYSNLLTVDQTIETMFEGEQTAREMSFYGDILSAIYKLSDQINISVDKYI